MKNQTNRSAHDVVIEQVVNLIDKYKLTTLHCIVSNYNPTKTLEAVMFSKSGKDYRSYVMNFANFKNDILQIIEKLFQKRSLSFSVEITSPTKIYFRIATETAPMVIKEIDHHTLRNI